MSLTDSSVGPDVSTSETPLRTTFRIKLNGETVPIGTVGQAFRFITNLSAIEWMEFRALHEDAMPRAATRGRQRDVDGAGDQRAAHAVRAGETAVSHRAFALPWVNCGPSRNIGVVRTAVPISSLIT